MQKKIRQAIENLKDDMITYIRRLVQTPSLPGDEKEVQEMIAQKLIQLNFNVDMVPIQKKKLVSHPAFSDDGFAYANRFNVVGDWISQTNTGRSLILNGHMDVVSPGDVSMWNDSPWSGHIDNGRIYGRGSADMKAGMSAAIFACQALQKIGFHPAGRVQIQSVVGEETGGCGTLTNILEGYNADAAIIAEPTQLRALPVQAGALSFRLRVRGKSIHACMKNQGVSAIEKFYILFQEIEAFDRRRHQSYSNPLFPDRQNVAPINIGTLFSGNWPSTVPDHLIAEGRFGIFPGESVDAARAAFIETIEKAASQDEWLKENPPEVEWFEGQFESGSTPLDSDLLQTLSQCHRKVLNREICIAGATYGSDLRLFTNYAQIPAVLYGPGDVKEAHAVNESIAISEIMEAANVLAYTIVKWCGGEILP